MSLSREERPLHLLSLDGGGVRGLSIIIILKHLMDNISRQRKRRVEPWEEFDMIGGTSTGGLIAIMLGRLRMTLKECEAAYLGLSEQIFSPKHSWFSPFYGKDFLLANGKFDCKILEEAIKGIITQRPGLDQSTLLKDEDPKCKVFVCATRTGNTEVAVFRSYDTTMPELLFDECKIWEACRATSAATTFFDPIKIGGFGQEFADGGVLYNNPIRLVEREASAIWPDRMKSAVMVSIGTGAAPGGAFRGKLWTIVEAMKKIVTETEKTNNDFFHDHKAMIEEKRLYRFNVLHGLADVGLHEWEEKEKIANTTQTYLERGEIIPLASSCIEQICKRGPAGSRNEFGAEQSVSNSDISSIIEPLRIYKAANMPVVSEDLKECIRSLSFESIDSRRNIISPAHQGTCEWLFETQSFTEWKDRTDLQKHNGVLWIKGHPGVGKSTLMKHTLLYCKEEFTGCNIAFYFFNARGRLLEKTPLGMLRSLMVQLLEQDSIIQQQLIPQFLKKRKRYREVDWDTGELIEFLLQGYERRQYKDTVLLIDALDECNESDVKIVVDFLETLSENAVRSHSNLRICLSSRHYPHINMRKKIELVVENEDEHDQDISKYVQSKLKTKNDDIRKHILQKANHIFMWAVLVIEMLNTEYNKGRLKAMRKKLEEIPSDLDELFSNLLEKENSEDDITESLLVFQWVLFSKQPLSPEELYFAVLSGTDPDELGPWDQSQIDVETIQRFITNASRGLVEIVSENDKYRSTISANTDIVQFIHQSVIDFLTRNQRLIKLAEMDQTLGHNVVGAIQDRLASCCMAYFMQKELKLLVRDKLSEVSEYGDTLDELDKSYPFLEYASNNLLLHAESAQVEGISQIPLLQQLENHDEIVQLLHGYSNKRSKYSKEMQLLYVVSVLDCYYLARSLLDRGADVNAQGGYYGNALQAAAAAWDSIDIVNLLLDRGADVNAQGGKYGNALQAAAAATARSSINTVKLLLDRGADVNAQGGYYGSTLQAAAAWDSIDIVNLLLDRGADVNTQGGYYGNALQAAAAAYEDSIEKVKLLLDRGADVNAQGGKYGNALQVAAAARGSIEKVKLLIDRGADVNAQGGKYGNALQAAATADVNSIDTVKLLIDSGADVNTQGGAYGTALEAAAAADVNSIDTVKLLIDSGADVNTQGGAYGTALEAAQENKRKDVIALLLEHGASSST